VYNGKQYARKKASFPRASDELLGIAISSPVETRTTNVSSQYNYNECQDDSHKTYGGGGLRGMIQSAIETSQLCDVSVSERLTIIMKKCASL